MSFRQQEIETENFTPRPYQLELLEKAKKSNLIVPLGTGTGKTFIAIMLIREMAADVRVPFEKGGKRSFFLVNTVSLVKQQADEIRVHTGLNVSEYHGSQNTDRWTSDRWEQELKENHVLVMTAQIFLDLINHGFFRLERANVIVFDECHHARKNHPYREIMRGYTGCPDDSKPRILGLSASIIGEDTTPSRLERLIVELERCLASKIETSSGLTSVAKYGAKPEMVTLKCKDFELRDEFKKVREVLQGTLAFCSDADFNSELEVDPRKPLKLTLKRILAVLEQLGPWCAWRVCTITERQLVKLDKYSMTEMEQLFILMGQTTIRKAKQMLEPYVSDVDSLEKALRWLPDRVNRLLEVLKAMNPKKREAAARPKDASARKSKDDHEFSGLVFVQQRYVAKTLRDCLKKLQSYAKDDYGYLKIDFIVGFSGHNDVAEEDKLSLHKRQEEVLKSFRQKHLNLLVATKVVEEGVDIRQCNCVIRFDPPQNFTSFVQSRGRARKANGKYIFLVEEKQFDVFLHQFNNFIKIEQILLDHCRSREVPSKEDIDLNNADQELPPYYPPESENEPMEGRPKVSMTTAIPLVNRYCAKLPSDVFTRLAPRYNVIAVIKNGTTYYQGSLTLPINSPVKEEIRGPLMPKQKLAQMATALEACKVLHQRQELDRHLLPVGKESAAKFLIEDDDEWVSDGRIRPGSTKRKQYYAKKIADPLIDARPVGGRPSYIHVIDMELATPAAAAAQNSGASSGRLSFDPSGYSRFWGVLSTKPMPKIPSFPVYARQGQLRVQIVSLPFTVRLDDSQLTSISHFHEYLFSYILRLEKYSMKYDPATANNALYIVPLKKAENHGYVLDFPFVNSITNTVEVLPRRPTEDEQEAFEFVREKYIDAVVMPWYRNSELPNFYYVTAICDHLNPSSPFPDVEYASFNEYFMQKYGLYIYNKTQPMLDVDYTHSRLNMTLPRYVGRRAQLLQPAPVTDKNSKQESVASLTQKQLLAPELVDVHPIPASLWSMIVCLPTVLYRVNSLLVADEWRRRVEKEAFGRDTTLPADFAWEPLTYGWRGKGSSKESSDADFVENESAANGSQQQNGNAAASNGGGDDTFEIGVWDPNLASSLVSVAPAPAANHPPNGLIADRAAAPATLNGRSDSTSANDDDWDDEDEIYFDVEISRRFMSLERRATTGGLNGETKFDDPFAPNANIVPTGWDAAGDSIPAGEAESAGGLSYLLSNGQFDANALLNDIAKYGVGTTVTPQPIERRPLTQPVDGPGPSTENVIDDKSRSKTTAKVSNRNRKRNVADVMDFDDCDEQKEEETLDLADLGITDEELAQTPAPDELGRMSPPMPVYEAGSPAGALTSSAKATLKSSAKEQKLVDFGEDEDMIDTKQAAKLTDEVFASPSTDVALLAEKAPILFQVDDFETKPYGPNPCLILQALTMSNANDGFNLERLETVGDSFLKYAVTSCLFNACPDFHEGKLSFLRSKHVSNYNLYKLGKRKGLGDIMVACKFEPLDNWLPPGFCPLEKDAENVGTEEDDKRMESVLEAPMEATPSGEKMEVDLRQQNPSWPMPDEFAGIIPYNLLTQHSIPDKSIADAVEAMIGVYLLTYGPDRTIQFLKWLGLKPTPNEEAWFKQSRQPLLHYVENPEAQLRLLWQRFNLSSFESEIGYVFKDKAYLVQAFTHASYHYNRVTDCYQRLEFLGDAVLDYMITRHLFEDKRQHSPGVLTDLRSALVNNTIFASLAVKYKFHHYFMALCPGMTKLMLDFVKMIQERRQESNFDEELYLMNEEEVEDEEDIEVPKALGDMFESVAGAIYLDSGGSLDAVWRVYYRMMKEQIEKCCANPPKSPIRELLELEPEKAKFAKLERDVVQCKVRVTVDVYGKGRFVGMGRNYRIAKCTAAKRALKYLKRMKATEAQEANGKA